jgi:pimeloyl-ACP methyl ester carboxylesterase
MTGDELEPILWSHRETVVNGVRLHYVEAGTGPLVLLLHGFPEFWYSWRWQIPVLAAAGFHVLAPDLRGYNRSQKPVGIQSYRMEVLTEDIAGLIRRAGADKGVVVGHDWGGGIAWSLAMRYPQLLGKLIILNAPHPATFLRELRTWRQLRKSLYIFFFQLPLVPELLLLAGNYYFFDRAFRCDPVRPDTFTEQDIARYKEALDRAGALTAALHYYRAAFRQYWRKHPTSFPPIDVPTLLIWGEQDRYLDIRLTHGIDQWVPRLRIERLAQASHWVQSDAWEAVNRLMIDFLGEG